MLISVWMTLAFIDGHSCIYEIKKIGVHFPANLSVCMKFSMLPQPVGLLKLMLNLFCTSNGQERELC